MKKLLLEFTIAIVIIIAVSIVLGGYLGVDGVILATASLGYYKAYQIIDKANEKYSRKEK